MVRGQEGLWDEYNKLRREVNSLGPTIEIFPRMPGPNISRACGGIAQLGERRQRRIPAGSVGRLVRYRGSCQISDSAAQRIGGVVYGLRNMMA